MLKINLLTERKAAEKWYYRWKLGDPIVDFLALDQDIIVRRRYQQELRILKKHNERVGNRVVKYEPSYSYVATMVNKRIKTTLTDGQGDFKSVDVIRIEPMRLFPRPRKPKGVCARSKDEPSAPSLLGVIASVPEPTPTITGWERGEVEHKSRRVRGFHKVRGRKTK